MSDDGQQFNSPEAGGPPPPPGDAAPPPPPGPPPESAPEPGFDAPPSPGIDAGPPNQGFDAPPQPGSGQPDPSQGAYAQPNPSQPIPSQPPAVAPMQNMAGSGAAEDTSAAVIAHVLALLTGVLGTGIYYAVSSDKSPWVRQHITEALNFSITVLGAYMVTGITFIGLLLWPFIWIWQIVLPIMAAMAANKGEVYRYPATIRLIKGPLDQPGVAQGYGGGQSY